MLDISYLSSTMENGLVSRDDGPARQTAGTLLSGDPSASQYPKTPGALNRTVTTEASPSASLMSMESTRTVDTSMSNASTASSGARIPLPSPQRPRLDPQYAARLARRSIATYQQSQSNQSNLMLPPPIHRQSNNQSIFRPSPIITPTSADSRSDSFILESPERTAARSSSYSSIGSGGSSGYTSISSGTPRRSFTTRFRSDVGQSDRFIPSRATSNFSFSLWDDSPSRPAAPSSTNTPEGDSNDSNNAGEDLREDNGADTPRNTDTTNNSQSSMLNELLRSELLGENIDPSAPGNIAVPYQGRNSAGGPLREGGNHFQYQSPRQAYHSSVADSLAPAVVDSFSLTPVGSAASQRLMSTPQKRKRRIQKVPFKVLDAPALQDDFYLNLVDW
jgi:hypothetical protein